MVQRDHFPECDEGVRFRDAPRRGQQQRESQIGRRVGENVGCVGHQDSAARGGWHVDIVESDGDIRNHAHAFELRNHVGCKSVDQLADDRLLAARACDQLTGGKAVVGGDIVDFGALLEVIDGFGVNAFGDQDGGHRVIILQLDREGTFRRRELARTQHR